MQQTLLFKVVIRVLFKTIAMEFKIIPIGQIELSTAETKERI